MKNILFENDEITKTFEGCQLHKSMFDSKGICNAVWMFHNRNFHSHKSCLHRSNRCRNLHSHKNDIAMTGALFLASRDR